MPHDFMPGLAGIPAAKSAVSDVDGERGVLEYRGIRVEELCERSSFLETTYLLLFGRLPDEATLNKWQQDIIHHRRVKYSIIDLMKCLPEQGHPMDALQAAVAALGMYYPGRNVQDFDNLLVGGALGRQAADDRGGMGATSARRRCHSAAR